MTIVTSPLVLTLLCDVTRVTSAVAVKVFHVIRHAEQVRDDVDHAALEPARNRLLVGSDVMQLQDEDCQYDGQ